MAEDPTAIAYPSARMDVIFGKPLVDMETCKLDPAHVTRRFQ